MHKVKHYSSGLSRDSGLVDDRVYVLTHPRFLSRLNSSPPEDRFGQGRALWKGDAS